jgi:transposase-like protein
MSLSSLRERLTLYLIFVYLSKKQVTGKGPLSPEQEELHRLRSENKRLLMEREVLKKAAAFFAKESS